MLQRLAALLAVLAVPVAVAADPPPRAAVLAEVGRESVVGPLGDYVATDVWSIIVDGTSRYVFVGADTPVTVGGKKAAPADLPKCVGRTVKISFRDSGRPTPYVARIDVE